MANGLTRRTAGAGVTSARDLFDRFFEDTVGRGLFPALWSEESASTQLWAPRVDITENDNELAFEAEVPGLEKDAVNVAIEDHVLTISGERKFEKDEKKENVHRIERSYGKFSRSFTLPTNVDPEKAEAKFKDGVLSVRVPKSETAKPRKIAVH